MSKRYLLEYLFLTGIILHTFSARASDYFHTYVIKCKGEDTYELYDYKEFYEHNRSAKFQLTGSHEKELLTNFFKEIKRFSVPREKLYKRYLQDVSKNLNYVTSIDATIDDDAFGFTRWSNCKIRPIARVTFDKKFETSRTEINRNIWKQLTARSRVGVIGNILINHEYIFELENSKTEYSRNLNALLSSNFFSRIQTKDELHRLHLKYNLNFFFENGIFYSIYNRDAVPYRNNMIHFDNHSKNVSQGEVINPPAYLRIKSIIKLNNLHTAKIALDFKKGIYISKWETNTVESILHLKNCELVSGQIKDYSITAGSKFSAKIKYEYTEDYFSFTLLEIYPRNLIHNGRRISVISFDKNAQQETL